MALIENGAPTDTANVDSDNDDGVVGATRFLACAYRLELAAPRCGCLIDLPMKSSPQMPASCFDELLRECRAP